MPRPKKPPTPRRPPPPPLPFQLEFYKERDGSEPVRDWLHGLTPLKMFVLGAAMRDVLQHYGVGVCKLDYGKPLGQGLFEFRLRLDATEVAAKHGWPPEQVLLRVFCHAHGNQLVLLLAGYDKGRDASPKRQDTEIALARKRLTDWRSRKR